MTDMEILYKYVTAERILSCLPEMGDGTLRATQLSSLNDPLECAVWPGSAWIESEEGYHQLAELLTAINEARPVASSDVSNAREQYGSLFLRELLAKQLSSRFGIISFSTDPRQPLMWSHYTTDASGFVIGYDADLLRTLGSREESLRRVVYQSRITPIATYNFVDSLEEVINALLSMKSDHWRYENEWRLIVELDKTIGTGHWDRHGQPINLVKVPNAAVVSVYYTERSPVEVVELLRARMRGENNRYHARQPTKLVLSWISYGYEDAPDENCS